MGGCDLGTKSPELLRGASRCADAAISVKAMFHPKDDVGPARRDEGDVVVAPGVPEGVFHDIVVTGARPDGLVPARIVSVPVLSIERVGRAIGILEPPREGGVVIALDDHRFAPWPLNRLHECSRFPHLIFHAAAAGSQDARLLVRVVQAVMVAVAEVVQVVNELGARIERIDDRVVARQVATGSDIITPACPCDGGLELSPMDIAQAIPATA